MMLTVYTLFTILAVAGTIGAYFLFPPEGGDEGEGARRMFLRMAKYIGGAILALVGLAIILLNMPEMEVPGWMREIDFWVRLVVGVAVVIFVIAGLLTLADPEAFSEDSRLGDWLSTCYKGFKKVQAKSFKIVISLMAILILGWGALWIFGTPQGHSDTTSAEGSAAPTIGAEAPLPEKTVELPKEVKCDGILDTTGNALLNWKASNPPKEGKIQSTGTQVCTEQGWTRWPTQGAVVKVLAEADEKPDANEGWRYYQIEWGDPLKQWIIRDLKTGS